jgi:ATP-dependent helicase/nuclease subunit A
MTQAKSKPPPPDAAARAQALDVTRSFIVQAPAGSGKTELLTERFVNLLAVVEVPSEVVAITFTRKAAAEMRARINSHLLAAAPGSAAHIAREKHPSVLRQPELLRVVTFDTLFRALTRFAPVALGVASDAMIDDAPGARYEKAAIAALAEGELAPQIETMLRRLDANYGAAVHLIAALLAKRDQWLPLSYDLTLDAAQTSALFETIAATEIARVLAAAKARLERDIPAARIGEWLRLARFASAHKSGGEMIGQSWPAADAAQLPIWLQLLELSVKKDGGFYTQVNVKNGFPATNTAEKAQWKIHQDAMGDFALEVCEIAQMLRALPVLSDLQSDAETLASIMAVLTHAAAQLHVDFAQTNSADFVHIALAAQRGVIEDEGVLRDPIARTTRHLLVDEFQDTSITQFNFLVGVTQAWEQIGTGEETLFCVGDPMQSIYRFRQAEVELFSKAQQEGLGAKALTPITLSANFRSDAPLVEWVNTHLESAIAAQNAVSRVAIMFAPGSPMNGARDTSAVGVYAFESIADEAAMVVKTVIQSLDESEGIIGILVPSRSAGAPIIDALRDAGVAFDARETERLSQSHWVQDLLSIAFALSEPEDALSWHAMLRAPWCGLTLPDLTCIAEAAGDTRSVWEATADELALTEEGRARLAQWRAQLSPCVAALGERPLAEIVEAAWARLDARACTPASSREDFEAVIEAIRTHEVAGRLLDRDALVNALDRLERANPSSARVQVMTIHKAKGLQFDTVIVPAMAKRGKSDDAPLLRWMRFPAGAMIVPKPIGKTDPLASAYAWLKGLEEIEQDAERARLLYVATTRAKRKLLLTATVQFDEADAPIRPARSLYGSLPAFTAFQCVREHEPTAGNNTPKFLRLLLRKADFAPQVLALSHAIVPLKPRETLASRGSRAFGTISHAWLCAKGHRGEWNADAQRWAQAQLRRANIPEPLRGQCVARLGELVARTQSSAHAAFVFDPKHEAWSELSFAAKDSTLQSITLRPDRIVCTNEGAWWVIDYKTSVPDAVRGESLENFVDKERATYRDVMLRYADAVRAWKEIPAAQNITCALYFPLIDQLVNI